MKIQRYVEIYEQLVERPLKPNLCHHPLLLHTSAKTQLCRNIIYLGVICGFVISYKFPFTSKWIIFQIATAP